MTEPDNPPTSPCKDVQEDIDIVTERIRKLDENKKPTAQTYIATQKRMRGETQ